MVILDEPKYLGKARVKNEQYGYNYEGHVWRVLFIRLDDIEYEEPMQGLLEARTKWLRKAGFLGQVANLFRGKCRILANEKGDILSVEEFS